MEWRCLLAIQPHGQAAADLRHARQMAQFAAAHRQRGQSLPLVAKYLVTDDAAIAADVEREDDPTAYLQRLAGLIQPTPCQTPSP